MVTESTLTKPIRGYPRRPLDGRQPNGTSERVAICSGQDVADPDSIPVNRLCTPQQGLGIIDQH